MQVKNVVLFGAGASHGSDHIIPEAPPLGNQLYQALRGRNPSVWGALSPELQRAFEADFEKGMLKVCESGSHLVGPLMQRMALFFTSFRLTDNHNLYSALLDRLQTNRALGTTLFSTLNYECVFELAASLTGLRVSYSPDLPHEADTVAIWKLHGSCNFIPDPQNIKMRRSASYSCDIWINTPQVVVWTDLSKVHRWLQGDNALYPAMCMYMAKKLSQISQGLFQTYWRNWAGSVRTARKVVVVGVRPSPQDEHIWQPLADTRANLYFVGDKNEFDAWAPNRSGGNSDFLGPTFRAAFEGIVEELAS